MNDSEHQSKQTNTGLVILIAVILLGVPCIGFVALAGVGLFFFRSMDVRLQVPPPVMVDEEPAPPEVAPPVSIPEEASAAPGY